MKSLVCPHCGSSVPGHASVCVGCGAEIVRGATRGERTGAGCLFALVCLVITMAIIGMRPLPPADSDGAFFVILQLIAVVIIANALGRLAMRWLRRSTLRFRRTYDHQ